MRSFAPCVASGWRKRCALIVLAYVWLAAVPAFAAVSAGTISFTGTTAGVTVTSNYNGLSFSNWMYDDIGQGYAYEAITPLVNYGTSGAPAIIKVTNSGDRFNLVSFKGAGYNTDLTITIDAYRSGSKISALSRTLTTTRSPLSSFTVNITNVDELRIYNGDGYLTIEQLVVAPYTTVPTISPTSLASATVGVAYSQTISASGAIAPYSYSLISGSLPAGLTLSTAGVLSGTPTAGGSFSFSVEVADSAGAVASQSYSLTVNSPTLAFSPATLTAGTVGAAYSKSISVSGGTAAYNTFSIASGALPAGLSLNASSGLISGTPTAGGSFSFTVSAKDSSGGTGPYTATSGSISLSIAAPTLSFSPATLTSATVGAAYAASLSASGGTAPYGNFGVATGSLPTGLSLSASGALSGTPTTAGSYTFTVSAKDSSSGTGPYTATSGSISLTVAAPTLVLAPASLAAAMVASAYSQTITASGGTAPYSYAVTAGSLPAGMSLSSSGLLSGTPSAAGSYSFTVTATDSSGGSQYTTSRAYSLTVSPQSPVAGAVTLSVAINSSANLVALNLSGGAPVSVTVVSAASHGTATVNGVSISYTPTTGYFGADSFTYTATNSSGTSAAATVTITVNPQAPVAAAVSLSVAFNSTANVVPLKLSGGTATSVALASAPGHGTASVSGIAVSYTPTSGYSGGDSFTYTASNAGGTSAVATVSIVVQPRADPSKDAEVKGLLNSQVQTAVRFGQTQIVNFQTRMENLHVRSRALAPDDKKSASGSQARPSSAAPSVAATRFASEPSAGSGSSERTAFSSSSASAACAVGTADGCIGVAIHPLSDDLSSVVLNTSKTGKTSSNAWPWRTLNVNGKATDPFGGGLAVWSAGTITVGRQSDSDASFTTSGISVGSDTRVGDHLTLGIGAGFGHERQAIGSNDSRNWSDGYSLLVYGSYQPQDGFFVDGLVGYGHLEFDAERYVTSTGGHAQSKRRGAQWLSSLSGGYDYVDGKLLLSPYVRLDLIYTRLKQSTESGAGIFDLTYFAQDSRSTKLAFGLRGETVFELADGAFKPNMRIEYQHEFAKPGVARMAYADDFSGIVYAYAMDSTDRNALVIGLGCDLDLRNSWQSGLSYRFSQSSSSSSQMSTFGVYLKRAF